jgi:hypothetical protein
MHRRLAITFAFVSVVACNACKGKQDNAIKESPRPIAQSEQSVAVGKKSRKAQGK